MVASGILPPDGSRDSFDTYDFWVNQLVPLLITTRERNSAGWNAEVVCLAPTNVTKGSHEPEGEFPPSAGRGLWPPGMGLVLAVAGVVGIVAG